MLSWCPCFLIHMYIFRQMTDPGVEVFVSGEGDVYDVYISPNDEYLPKVPRRERSWISPNGTVERGWASDETFYAAFIPETNPFDDQLFGVLSLSAGCMREVPGRKSTSAPTYRLAPLELSDWRALEVFLVQVEACISTWGGLQFPLNFRRPRSPSSSNYDAVFESKTAAMKGLSKARASFLLWGGLISYELMRLEDVVPLTRRYTWDRGLCTDGFAKPSVVAVLRNSWVSNWAIRRLGGFVDCTRRCPGWVDAAQKLVKVAGHCLPLYFFFGSGPVQRPVDDVPRSLYDIALPLLQERVAAVQQARAKRAEILANDWSVSHANEGSASGNTHQESSAQVTDPNAPAPYPGSRQRRGEDLFGFLQRERQHSERVLAAETPQARERREKREKVEQTKEYPSRRGPTSVYHWVRVRGYWMRELVWKSRYQALWNDTNQRHRIYNSVTNEWDVSVRLEVSNCKEVDESYDGWDMLIPDPVDIDVDIDYADLDDEETSQIELRQVSTDERTRRRSHSPTRPSTASDRVTLPFVQIEETALEGAAAQSALLEGEYEFTAESEGIESTMTYRYGLGEVAHYTSSTQPTDKTVNKAYRILCVPRKVGPREGPFCQAVLDTTFRLLEYEEQCRSRAATANAPDVPLDVNPSDPRHIALKESSQHVVTVKVDSTGRARYALLLGDNDRPWWLVVDSATTALEVVRSIRAPTDDDIVDETTALEVMRREWGPTKDEVVNEFVKLGIRFHTYTTAYDPAIIGSPVSDQPLVLPQSRAEGLGYREPGYAPTISDYVVYEKLRRNILRRPHARVALQRGGILWRLACEEMDATAVLLGPSCEGQVSQEVLDGVTLYEDSLSEEEVYTICGVYRIYTSAYLPNPFYVMF